MTAAVPASSIPVGSEAAPILPSLGGIFSQARVVDRRKVPYTDLLKISSMLDTYHKVFYVFFSMAGVYFTDEIPTAAVEFSKYGKPQLLLNEGFWNSLNEVQQVFVICHECMHVLLDHGVRNGKDVKGATPYLVNVAQDITINEMIVGLFGYDRNNLPDWKKFCWIDTCFKDPFMIEKNQTFTYYLKKLITEGSNDVKNQVITTFDHHSGPSDPSDSPFETAAENKAREDLANKLAQELPVDAIKAIKDALPDSAGTARGNYEFIIAKKERPIKLRLTKLIQKLKRTRMQYIEKVIDSFASKHRRFLSLLKNNPDVKLQGEAIIEKQKKDRLLVLLFMDVSGSCLPYVPLFRRIMQAFMLEEKVIETIPFAFDTRVVPVQYNSKLYMGGGTAFNIIEDQCRKYESEKGRYPDCVIIVTDGEGTQVTPKHPDRWIWILTPYNIKTYIHSRSRHYGVKDVIIE